MNTKNASNYQKNFAEQADGVALAERIQRDDAEKVARGELTTHDLREASRYLAERATILTPISRR